MSTAMAATRWLAPACLLIGAVLMLVALFRSAADRGPVDDGIVYTVATYDQALPLIGLGIGLAQLALRQKLLVCLFFAAGVLAGTAREGWLLSAALAPGSAGHLVFVGPASCVAVGLALLPPSRVRAWAMPVIAVLLGAAFGFLIALNDPASTHGRFAWSAACAGLWLVAAPPLLVWWPRRSWLAIGSRVFASWLIAIGVMLGGSKFVAMQRAEQRPASTLAPLPDQFPGLPGQAVNEGQPGNRSRQPW
jgi:hypothetical protein